MLKIQLCPESELENPHWYTYDVLALFVVCLFAWMASDLWLGNMRNEITRLNETSANWDRQLAEVQPVVEKFNGLDAEVATLNRKIEALKRITVAHGDKVRPIVVMEQMQTLHPEGLWFEQVSLDEKNHLHIVGASSDSLLISEFLLGLRETMNPDTWTTDIRTQIGFQNIEIKDVVRMGVDPNFRDVNGSLRFDATAEVSQKTQPPMGAVATGPRPRSILGARF